MRRHARFAILLTSLFLAGGLATANAGPAATIDDTTGLSLANGPYTLGWQFTTSTSLTVTALGVFDANLDGLADRHTVGIWDNSGTLLTSATVASGTSDPLTNQFRYVSIAALLLDPGTYRIGAVWNSNTDDLVGDGFTGPTNLQMAPGITFDGNAFIAGGALVNPTSSTGGNGYFGPNFITSTEVPEPATIALLGGGLVGFRALRRRRKPKA